MTCLAEHPVAEKVTVVAPQEVDLATVGAFRAQLVAAIESGAAAIDVDLHAVDFCGVTGLAAIVAAHDRARRGGVAFVLVAPPPGVVRLLHLAGLDRDLAGPRTALSSSPVTDPARHAGVPRSRAG